MVVLVFALGVNAQVLGIKQVKEISFQETPGVEYEIQYNTNLNAGVGWQKLETVFADAFGKVRANDDSNDPLRIYRTVKIGVDGEFAVSLDAEPSWAYLRAGRDEIVASYSVKAGASAMRPIKFTLDFDKQLWHYARAITILDGTTVLVSKYNLNATDFTQVGTVFQLDLPVSDFYQVTPSQTKHLAVLLHAFDVEDRPPTTINVTRFDVNATDSATATANVHAVTTSPRMFLYKGIAGEITAKLSVSNPPARLVQISRTAQTDNVLLAMFELKSARINGTLRQIAFGLDILDRKVAPVTDLFSEVTLYIDGNTHSGRVQLYPGADFVGYVVFEDLNQTLLADQFVTLRVYGKINPDTEGKLSGAKVAVSLTPSTSPVLMNNPEVQDGAFQPIDVVATTTPIQATPVTFSSQQVVVSAMSQVVGESVLTNNEYRYGIALKFTLTAGNDTIYLGRSPIVTTASEGVVLESAGLAAQGIVPGDHATYFVVPAGSSRTFEYGGMLRNLGAPGLKTFGISGIKFGSMSENLSSQIINYGLEPLTVSVTF